MRWNRSLASACGLVVRTVNVVYSSSDTFISILLSLGIACDVFTVWLVCILVRVFKEHGKQYIPFHLIDLIRVDKCAVHTRLPVCLLDCLLLWEEGRGMSAMEHTTQIG